MSKIEWLFLKGNDRVKKMEISQQFITVQGALINVTSTGSGENAILFVHGNSSNADCWQQQLTDPTLSSAYKLIALDLPGHGASGSSGNYHLKHLAIVLSELIQALGLKRYILVGHSYGTCIIGEAAKALPEGCKGVLLASSNVVGEKSKPEHFLIPHPSLAAMVAADADETELYSFATLLIPHSKYFIRRYIESYEATDPEFRTTLADDIAMGAYTDELANLRLLAVPVCIVFGRDEAAVRTDYLDNFPLRWKEQIFHLPTAGHFVQIEAPEEFNALLTEFAASRFR